MDVLSVCPLLLCQNKEQSIYEGFLTVKGQNFYIHVDLGGNVSTGDGKLSQACLRCEWRLHQLLLGYQHVLQQERRLENSPASRGVPSPPTFYNQLISGIEDLGWDRLVFIDSNFQQLRLQATDRNNRRHVLKLQLSPEHPVVSPMCHADFPSPFQLVWSCKTSTLRDIYQQFKSQLEVYQDFWDMLDELDKNTWVLEPEHPTRGATNRRIALGNNASVQIEVAASHPRMLPECRFLGADHASLPLPRQYLCSDHGQTAHGWPQAAFMEILELHLETYGGICQVINPLKENMNQKLHQWSMECSLLTNLQNVLGVKFPSPQNTKKEDLSAECGICYAYRLDGAIPDQVCEDSRCNQPFHQQCLYEWLRGLTSSRQSFNTVFGECPYCSKPITVKMPTR